MNTSHDETPADNQGALTRAQIEALRKPFVYYDRTPRNDLEPPSWGWNAALDAVLTLVPTLSKERELVAKWREESMFPGASAANRCANELAALLDAHGAK